MRRENRVTCKSCKHYLKLDYDNMFSGIWPTWGVCRRRSPKHGHNYQDKWPTVSHMDICGDHEYKERIIKYLSRLRKLSVDEEWERIVSKLSQDFMREMRGIYG